MRTIEYLSDPDAVSMGDTWFELASPDHFWMRRRFEVLKSLCPELRTLKDSSLAEVGCGHGALQQQFEEHLDLELDGFDLNVKALEMNLSTRSRVACYNIFDRNPALQNGYEGLFLFDVLEHIDDTTEFLGACLDMLKPGGKVYVNMPASMRLYSAYDKAVGHVCRYDPQMIVDLAAESDLQLERWTYWGLPLTPILWLRNQRIRGVSGGEIIRRGFDPPGKLGNQILLQLSRLEWLPQQWFGTSLMAVFRKGDKN